MPNDENGHQDLYKRYRPTILDNVVGQEAAIKTLKGFGARVPNAILLDGPSGVGKTTIARALAKQLRAGDAMSLREVNCASVKSAMEMAQEIEQNSTSVPLGGGNRVWILDEVQSLSRAHFAQQAMLKVLEDSLPFNYFFLCTTEPKKVIAAVRSRCTPVHLNPIPESQLLALVRRVADAEKLQLGEKVAARVAEAAAGSARNALVELQRVAGLSGEAEQLAAITVVGAERAAFDMVKALMPYNGPPSWPGVVAVIEGIKGEDPEGVRQLLLACAAATLRKGGKGADRAYTVIQAFRDPLYDRNSGWAIFTANAWEVVNPRR